MQTEGLWYLGERQIEMRALESVPRQIRPPTEDTSIKSAMPSPPTISSRSVAL